jgi:hypothetical protein
VNLYSFLRPLMRQLVISFKRCVKFARGNATVTVSRLRTQHLRYGSYTEHVVCGCRKTRALLQFRSVLGRYRRRNILLIAHTNAHLTEATVRTKRAERKRTYYVHPSSAWVKSMHISPRESSRHNRSPQFLFPNLDVTCS